MTSLHAVRALQQAGFSEAQAAAVLEAVSEAVNEHAATKADLKDMELRLTKEMTDNTKTLTDKFDAFNARLLNGAMVIIAALIATTAGAVFTLFQLLKWMGVQRDSPERPHGTLKDNLSKIRPTGLGVTVPPLCPHL